MKEEEEEATLEKRVSKSGKCLTLLKGVAGRGKKNSKRIAEKEKN